MSTKIDNSWQDVCWVTIAKDGGSDTHWCSKTRDITVGGGSLSIDTLNVNCGQIIKLNRPEPFEITFDNILPVTADDFRQFKEGGTDTTQPIEVTSGTSRDQFRVAILWANTTGLAGATVAVTDSAAYRIVARDCYFTGMEERWTDQLLEGSATFTVPAEDSSGNGCMLWQSITGSGTTLSALTSYTAGSFGN